MRAIDTNVVIRFVVGDDPEQCDLATSLISKGVFVSDTVLIEVEWVLRGGLDWPRERINRALSDFLAMESVEVAHRQELRWALDRYRAGADWADMLHLIAARGRDAFATFDKALVKQASATAPVAVELLI